VLAFRCCGVRRGVLNLLSDRLFSGAMRSTTLLTPEQTDRVIEMAWEDRTPFEAIHFQFGLPEAAVILLMRRELSAGAFRRWRRRVNSGISHKHAAMRPAVMKRFRCSRQRQITGNKISKR